MQLMIRRFEIFIVIFKIWTLFVMLSYFSCHIVNIVNQSNVVLFLALIFHVFWFVCKKRIGSDQKVSKVYSLLWLYCVEVESSININTSATYSRFWNAIWHWVYSIFIPQLFISVYRFRTHYHSEVAISTYPYALSVGDESAIHNTLPDLGSTIYIM